MNRSLILLIDASISLVLGIVLAVFPKPLVELLGLPASETAFYPSILGAVVIGIAIALFYEWRRPSSGQIGLGVAGAIAIDLSAAMFLIGWLIVGDLNLSIRGTVILWGIVGLLIGVSILGLFARRPAPGE
ncbi:hypothetical protein GC197_09150 [bacterium]|nr:hypothetical protein [bacterium]